MVVFSFDGHHYGPIHAIHYSSLICPFRSSTWLLHKCRHVDRIGFLVELQKASVKGMQLHPYKISMKPAAGIIKINEVVLYESDLGYAMRN